MNHTQTFFTNPVLLIDEYNMGDYNFQIIGPILKSKQIKFVILNTQILITQKLIVSISINQHLQESYLVKM